MPGHGRDGRAADRSSGIGRRDGVGAGGSHTAALYIPLIVQAPSTAPTLGGRVASHQTQPPFIKTQSGIHTIRVLTVPVPQVVVADAAI